MRHVAIFESLDFRDIKIPLGQRRPTTEAYRLLANGTPFTSGSRRHRFTGSIVGRGARRPVLRDGDTLRAPLTEIRWRRCGRIRDPEGAHLAARPPLIARPTAARRARRSLAKQVRPPSATSAPIKIAVMGCVVNGPARRAPIRIAGGGRG
jgi:4-hydroxy-3-methylbut-2-en-1-yl diphosphate synthase IspG/GcpE